MNQFSRGVYPCPKYIATDTCAYNDSLMRASVYIYTTCTRLSERHCSASVFNHFSRSRKTCHMYCEHEDAHLMVPLMRARSKHVDYTWTFSLSLSRSHRTGIIIE